jgi:hypothetical protein
LSSERGHAWGMRRELESAARRLWLLPRMPSPVEAKRTTTYYPLAQGTRDGLGTSVPSNGFASKSDGLRYGRCIGGPLTYPISLFAGWPRNQASCAPLDETARSKGGILGARSVRVRAQSPGTSLSRLADRGLRRFPSGGRPPFRRLFWRRL